MENFYSFDYKFQNRVFTSIYDKQAKLICVLINWIHEKQFNKDVLNKFDEFEIYNVNNELNLKVADFITNYCYYEEN